MTISVPCRYVLEAIVRGKGTLEVDSLASKCVRKGGTKMLIWRGRSTDRQEREARCNDIPDDTGDASNT